MFFVNDNDDDNDDVNDDVFVDNDDVNNVFDDDKLDFVSINVVKIVVSEVENGLHFTGVLQSHGDVQFVKQLWSGVVFMYRLLKNKIKNWK